MQSDPFFQAGMDVNIEARGIHGEAADINGRNCFLTLKNATQKAVIGLVLASSMMSSMAGTIGQLEKADVLTAPPAIAVVTNNDQAKDALAKLSPSIKPFLSEFNVIYEKIEGLNNSGPVMQPEIDSEAKMSCTISIVDNFKLMENATKFSGLNQDFSEAQKALFTTLTLRHEAAHCEYEVAKIHQVPGKVGENLYNAYHYVENIRADATTGFSLNARTLLGERHADASAILSYTADVFKNANDASSIKESVKKFDFAIKTMMSFRSTEMREVQLAGANFNNHDTQPVIIAINKLVHNAASSPAKMNEFRLNTLTGDNLTIKAMDLSLGSVRSELKSIYENQVKDAVYAAKKHDNGTPEAAKNIEGLMALRGNSDRLIPNDSDFGEELESFYKVADQTYAMSNVDVTRAATSFHLTSNLIKKLGESETNKPYKTAKPGG